jgi:hypothetical protein
MVDGDAISVQGAFEAELYDHGSEKRIALRQLSKARKLS